MSTVEDTREYQLKKRISDLKEEIECKAHTEISIKTYQHFGYLGPVTKNQEKKWLKKEGYCSEQEYINKRLIYYFGHLDPRKGKNMNDTEINAFASASALDEVGQPVDAFVEVIDDNGNPTGTYTANPKYDYDPERGYSEATPEEVAFIAEDSDSRAVPVTFH